MLPTQFPGQKLILGAPKDWDAKTHGECVGLPVTVDPTETAFVSVWVLSDEERQKIVEGGKVMLQVFSQAHPAISLSVIQEGEFPLDVKASG